MLTRLWTRHEPATNRQLAGVALGTIGVVLIPLVLTRLQETRGPADRLDLGGLALASAGLLGIVWGLVRGHGQGWTSPEIVGSLTAGAIVLALFVLWELRVSAPMLPMLFFRSRAFALANVASLLMFFGMFGSIFLLSQFFQTVQGYSPLGSGLRILPWTIMPMFVAPVAGALSDKIGGARLMGIGLVLQSAGLVWIASVSTATVAYVQLIGPFVISGIGMAMFWAPVANVVLSAVRPEEEGQASGSQNAIRELGGVFGVAVLGAVVNAQLTSGLTEKLVKLGIPVQFRQIVIQFVTTGGNITSAETSPAAKGHLKIVAKVLVAAEGSAGHGVHLALRIAGGIVLAAAVVAVFAARHRVGPREEVEL